MDVFGTSDEPKKFILDTGASKSFINKNDLNCFDHCLLDNMSEQIILADGSTKTSIGSARVTLNLTYGERISLVFKILPSCVHSGLIGSNFLRSYDIITSVRHLRHIRSGVTIPFKLEPINSSKEEVLSTVIIKTDLTPVLPQGPSNLTPTYPQMTSSDRNSPSMLKSADFAFTTIQNGTDITNRLCSDTNVKNHLFGDHSISSDRLRDFSFENRNAHGQNSKSDRDLSPDPLRDK